MATSASEEDWYDKLSTYIKSLGSAGTFAMQNTLGSYWSPAPVPNLNIDGVGPINFPLSPQQASAIVFAGQAAPYGQGAETVLDTKVRNARQDIKKDALKELGFSTKQAETVVVNLYKLLLYPAGGHFATHRDTEKEPGMFGTLIVQLPAGHKGGALAVRHNGEEIVWETERDSNTQIHYCAFYADCEHELKPVTSGWRLVLVYNLVYTAPLPKSFYSDTALSAAQDLLDQSVTEWETEYKEVRVGDYNRLAVLLEHHYTLKSLSFNTLKGRDRDIANLFLSCNKLDVYLVLMERHVYGRPGKSRRQQYNLDSDEGSCPDDLCEVYDDDEIKSHWYSTEGPMDNKYPEVRDDELINAQRIFKACLTPVQEDYVERTGNEGATQEYWYHRVVLVAWPKSQRIEQANQAGYKALLSLAEHTLKDANWWDLTQDAWRRQKEYAAAQAAKEPKTPGDSCSEDSDSEHTHSAAPSRVEAAAVGDGLSSLTLQSEPSAQSANEPVTGDDDLRMREAVGEVMAYVCDTLQDEDDDPKYFTGYSSDHASLFSRTAKLVLAGAALNANNTQNTAEWLLLAVSQKHCHVNLLKTTVLCDELLAMRAHAKCVEAAQDFVTLVERNAHTYPENFKYLLKHKNFPKHLHKTVVTAAFNKAMASLEHNHDSAKAVASFTLPLLFREPSLFMNLQATLNAKNEAGQLYLAYLLRSPRIAAVLEHRVLAPYIAGLIAIRLRCLDIARLQHPGTFSWCMAQGDTVPSIPELKAFLRGPEQSLTFRDRDVVRAIKNRAWESPVMCSFTTQVHRKTVTVTKTRDWYDQSLATYNRHSVAVTREQQDLAPLLRKAVLKLVYA